MSFFHHARELTVSYYDMIKDLYAHYLARIDKPFRDQHILTAWGRIAARVVVLCEAASYVM